MKKKVITGLLALLLLLTFFLVPGCDEFSLIEVLANDISLIPGEITLNLEETIKFEVSAGISPFVFTEIGDGIIPDGIYTAPAVPGNITISVQDDRNRVAEAYVTVVDAVVLAPATVSTGIGGILSFTINGGTDPFTVTLDPDLGTLGPLNYDPVADEYDFVYTAVSAGTEVIRVTDSLGQISEAFVTIDNNPELMIIPDVVEVKIGDTFRFSASGGTVPYVYSIETVVRSLDGEGFVPVTRIYTAPSIIVDPPIATIRVTDADSSTAEATIYIVAELLTINPSVSLTLNVGDEYTFSAYNGILPYTFSILPGDESSGSIGGGTGLFTALAKDPSVTVIVTDSNGNTDTCKVKVKVKVKI